MIDNGETMLVEGLRVAPQERGKGVAGVLLRFCSELVKSKYPEVKVTRLTRDDQLGPKDFQKYRIITKQVPATKADQRSFISFGLCLYFCLAFVIDSYKCNVLVSLLLYLFVSSYGFLLHRVFFWYASELKTSNFVCLSLVWMEIYSPLHPPPPPTLLQYISTIQLSSGYI